MDDIDGRVFFWPLSLFGFEQFAKPLETPNAHRIYPNALNLPSYHDLGVADRQRVIDHVLEHFSKASTEKGVTLAKVAELL